MRMFFLVSVFETFLVSISKVPPNLLHEPIVCSSSKSPSQPATLVPFVTITLPSSSNLTFGDSSEPSVTKVIAVPSAGS